MTHEEYQELVSQYIDEELEEGIETVLFQHLGECSQCRDFLRSSLALRTQILRTKEAAPKTLRPDFAPERAKEGVERDLLVLAWQRKVPLPVAASLAIFLLVSGLFFSSLMTQDRQPQQASTDINLPIQFQP
jgi:predicted anti-sigma-YlaC factor YlaD